MVKQVYMIGYMKQQYTYIGLMERW